MFPPGAALAPVLALAAACKVLPPPPAVPFHGTTAADPKGETQVMLVVGLVSEMIGGSGWGMAVRVEHQETERTSLGVELTGGRGDADERRFTALALRAYGRGTPRSHDWVAVTYGAGVTVLTTGMVTLGLHGGGAVSYPNRRFEPYLVTGLALAVPLTQGEKIGDMKPSRDRNTAIPNMGDMPMNHFPGHDVDGTPVRTNLYWILDAGFVVPLGDTDHALSLDIAAADGVLHPGGLFALSLAERASGL